MDKLCEMIRTELDKVVEKGLTNNNLETVYKLVDIYKDLKNVEYWEITEEAMERGGYSGADSWDDGMSMRGYSRGGYSRDGYSGDDYSRDGSYGRHYVRGHYSRSGYDSGRSMAYDKYMDQKRSYRSSKSADCKERLMDSLDEYMGEFADKLQKMAQDADCAEERQTIDKYVQMIRSIR